LYRKKDPQDQGVTKNDLFTLFKEGGFLVTEQIKLDILNCLSIRTTKIDFMEFVRIWGLFHTGDENNDEDQINYDYIDAFVAMGGNPDTTGTVKRQKVISIIEEFELTIDMEEF